MDRIGFIGLGLMGKPMALNLLKKGFSLTVHSRSQDPVDALVAAGAAAAASPAEVARRRAMSSSRWYPTRRTCASCSKGRAACSRPCARAASSWT